jgi:DNA-binding transcriptional regulator YiaG
VLSHNRDTLANLISNRLDRPKKATDEDSKRIAHAIAAFPQEGNAVLAKILQVQISEVRRVREQVKVVTTRVSR